MGFDNLPDCSVVTGHNLPSNGMKSSRIFLLTQVRVIKWNILACQQQIQICRFGIESLQMCDMPAPQRILDRLEMEEMIVKFKDKIFEQRLELNVVRAELDRLRV